ncbi:hypothetical protein B7463_g5963, partial [Scytalidium lignicola]
MTKSKVRSNNVRQKYPLNDNKCKAANAPRAPLDDWESDMPFGSWSAACDAQEADDDVSYNDGQHSLPDIESKGDKRGPCSPSTNVERPSDDPECNKFPGAECPSFRLQGTGVEIGMLR